MSKLPQDGEGDIRPHGVEIKFSKLFTESFYVLASYAQLKEEFEGVDFDFANSSAGIGYRYPITKTTDFYGAIAYENLEIEAEYENETFSVTDNGYSVQVGLLTRWFVEGELDFFIKRFESDGSVNVKGIEFNYYIAYDWQFNVSYSTSDVEQNYTAGISYVF